MQLFCNKYFVILLIELLFNQNAFSSVNIISWWNYLDKETISKLEKACNTTVSVDEYYTSDEFIRRFNKQNNYSIIIFSSGVYNFVSKKIENNQINFGKIKKNYHPNVQKFLKKQIYSENTAVFSLGTTGFLYNSKEIEILKSDNMRDIISKVKNKRFSFLIDDPFESFKLIINDKNISNVDIDVKEFRNLIDGSYFVAANDILKIVEDKDFIFSYSWIGESYQVININSKLNFMVHPKLSYISADLIATLDKKLKTICVTNMLANKDTLEPILSKNFYFSPFGVSQSNNSFFMKENKIFIDNINELNWLATLEKDEYKKMINLWYRFKIALENELY